MSFDSNNPKTIGGKGIQGGFPADSQSLIFNSTTNQWEFGVSITSELEFIRDKILAGDWFEVSGDINAVNDTIEFIPPSGKTAFLFKAKIVITTHTNYSNAAGALINDRVRADLLINAVVKDKTNIGMTGITTSSGGGLPSGGLGSGSIGDGKFNALGLSLVGDGALKIEIKNSLDNGSAFATMSGWLEDT